MTWWDDAACKDHPNPDLWFPEQAGATRARFDAIMVCRQCPVQQQCLEYAVQHRTVGIWGGTTTLQRKPMLGAPPRELRPCGTVAAYRRHKRRGEPVCRACREAEREYGQKRARS